MGCASPTRRPDSAHLDIIQVPHHDARVRTTLTLDDDVAAKVKEHARRKRVPFKDAVNALLRRGLVAPEPRTGTRRRVRVQVFDSPFRAGIDPLKLNQLVDDLAAEDAATLGSDR